MSAYESCCPRRDMDNVATGIIDHAHLEEKPASPERVGANGIGERDPERHENNPSGEAHSAKEGTRHNNDSDSGEYELEIDHS